MLLEPKIRKFGNSLGVVLPKEVISLLADQQRGAAFPDRVLWLSPAHAAGHCIREEDGGKRGRNYVLLSQHTLHALSKESKSEKEKDHSGLKCDTRSRFATGSWHSHAPGTGFVTGVSWSHVWRVPVSITAM